jgi:hypothetical protein
VIGVVVAVVVIVALLAASGVFSPRSSSPTGAKVTQNLINTGGQTFGPGTTNAAVITFTIPSTAIHAWVNGTFAVTVCTSIGNYCLANAWLFTPSAWANYQSGAAVTGTCLTQELMGNCQSEQNFQVASPDLSFHSGQTLDLCLWSNATTESQTFSADVNFVYMTSG